MQETPDTPSLGRPGSRIASTIAALILSTIVLSVPASLNGFPFIFYDTSSYLKRSAAAASFLIGAEAAPPKSKSEPSAAAQHASEGPLVQRTQNPFFLRPITYSAFLVPFSTKFTFFLVPFAQALLSAYVLLRLFQSVGISKVAPFLLSVFALAVFTSLPIQVGYVMPDLFTALLIIFSFVTIRTWSERSMPGRFFDIGLMTFFIAVHLSHIPIALALIVACFVTLAAVPRRFDWRATVLGICLPLLLAVSFLTASNALAARKYVISESSPLFLLARLVGDGPARAYLAQACPQKGYLICRELNNLGAHSEEASISDYFLWNPNGAVKRIADPRLVTEAAEINAATIRAYPLWVALAATHNAARQLVTFQVDDDINNRAAPMVSKIFERIGGDLPSQYLNSAQSRGRFPLEAARALLAIGLAGAAAILMRVVAKHRHDVAQDVWAFAFVAVTGVCANALAIGALSEVHDRYQNRVIWLLPLVALLAAWSAHMRRREGSTSDARD